MGNIALHVACWNGYGPSVIRELLRVGAHPFAQNKYG